MTLLTYSNAGAAGVVALVLYAVWKFGIKPRLSPLNAIPTVPRSGLLEVFLGKMPTIIASPPCEPQLQWRKKYGPVVHYLGALGQERVFVSDTSLVKDILVRRVSEFPKPRAQMKELQRVTGEGLLVSKGKTHARHRRILSTHFRFENLTQIVPIFADRSKALIQRWDALIAKNGGTAELELHSEFSRYTLDVIGLSAFAYDFRAMETVDNPIYRAYGKLLTGLTLFKLLRFGLPFLRHLPIEANTSERDATATVRAKVQEIVQTRLAERSSATKHSIHTLLDIMLEGEGENQLTADEITDQVLTFLVAGHETTSNALCWTWHLLSQNPEAQLRAREEAQKIISDPSNPTMTWDDLKQIPYIAAVCKESLRMYPPAPLTLRQVQKDTNITTSAGKSYTLPRDTMVFLSPYVNQNSEDLWDSPQTFRPERFFPGGEGDGNPNFMPFLAGPRSCIGSRFALAELQVGMVTLLARYNMAPKPGHTVNKKLKITLRPSPGLPMLVSMLPQ